MIYFNLLVDDFHPGITWNSQEWLALETLLEDYPQLKVTLFTVADWDEDKVRERALFKSYRLTCHPGWVKWVMGFDHKRIEINFHGYNHWSYSRQTSQEFAGLTFQQANSRINKMEYIFKMAFDGKLPKIKGFRVPGHLCGPDLYNVLKARKYKYLSIHHGVNKDVIKGITVIESGTPTMFNAHFGKDSPNSLTNPKTRTAIRDAIYAAMTVPLGKEVRFVTLGELAKEMRK